MILRQVPFYIRRTVLAIAFGLCPVFSLANPYLVQGVVINQQTGEPLPRVNIAIVNSRHGTVTGPDGSFSITYTSSIDLLRITHVGFETLEYRVDPSRALQLIALNQRPHELLEVLVRPGLNPALRIIDNAIAAKQRNNPKSLQSFTYTTYTRFVVSGSPQSSPEPASPPTPADSAELRRQEFFDSRHFMISESVSNKKFLHPSRMNETVVANRISGFQHPEFSILASLFQSFSVYESPFSIAGRSFVSPISREGRNNYSYLLLQTEVHADDSVFVIRFEPMQGRNFSALSGLMHITSNGWAVKSFQAKPTHQTGLLHFSITQNQRLVDGSQWFPYKLHFRFETEVFLEEPILIYAEGNSHIQNIRINPPLAQKDFGPYHLDFASDMSRGLAILQNYRPDTLSRRELTTFVFLDSLGKANNWDRVFDRTGALIRGRVRAGFVDFGILHFLRHNDVRGLIPGLDISTNDDFSRYFSLQGNVSYGLRNQSLTYGVGASVLLWNRHGLRAGYNFQSDFAEPGGSVFLTPPTLLSPDALRSYFLTNQDLLKSHTAWVQTRALRNFLWLQTYLSHESTIVTSGYLFRLHDLHQGYRNFRFAEVGIRARIGVGEQFIRTPTRMLTIEGRGPILHLNLGRGISFLGNAQKPYWRAEARITTHYSIPGLGSQHWKLQLGYVSSNVPWTKLFTAPASYRRFAISTPSSFSTMRINEFVSNRYAMAFFVHNFRNRLWGGSRASPHLLFLTNIAIGELSNPEFHLYAPFRQMNKGFIESGFALENLLRTGFAGLGIEFLYRYGAYSFPGFADNFTIRLRLSMLLTYAGGSL